MNAITPLSAVTAGNPYPYYAALVAEKPLYFDAALGMWVASSARAVEDVLVNERLHTRPAAQPVPPALAGTPPGSVFSRLIRMTDGEAAANTRSAVVAALRTLDVRSVAAAAQTSVQSLMHDRFRDDPKTLPDMLFALPALTLATLFGFSRRARENADRWTGGFVRAIAAHASDADIAAGAAATASMEEALRAALGDDAEPRMLYAILLAECRARQVDDAGAAANAIGLLFQSYDATAGLIGNTLKHLATGESCKPRGGESALADMIAEVARYDSPVQNTRRYASAGAQVLGETIREGEAVLVVLAAANRDPLANPDPGRFDGNREDRRTYTFGLGAHACPGAMIAATIARVAVATLLENGIQLDLLLNTGYVPSSNVRIPDFRGLIAE
ncbi:MAG: cytochrome P450 [Candidatus Eremiobacteraeota bacterium]|nr:cytochrome P450 [Candidatus Eremiobacteraeota bacterium]